MKRIVTAFALIICLFLTGCVSFMTGNEAFSTDNAEPSEKAQETDLPPGTYPHAKGRINEDGMLKIVSGGETILPFEHEIIGQTLSSYAGLVEEGYLLSECDPYFLDFLPVIDRSKDFELEVYEWGSIYSIDVFGSGFDIRAYKIDAAELYEYVKEHDETLIIDVQIFVPGCNIFEEPTERTGTGYAFIICGSDKEASKEPFMRLYSNGIEVGTREFFFYGTSAYYEDGVAKGMLNADGKAFFDSNHIAEAYDTLPIYDGCRVEGLDIRLKVGARVVQIFVYDPANDFERTTLTSLAELDELIAVYDDEYVVEVLVFSEGDYIEELGQSESRTNGYAFIVK